MLTRMYIRWAEERGYKVSLVEESEGEEAGIKSATLVRSKARMPTAGSRPNRACIGWCASRPTTAMRAGTRALPASGSTRWSMTNIEIDIKESDCRIDTYRASGAGGQHVNTTNSAVRITHIPTNIVVASQQERSQIKNRAIAWAMLKSRLYELELKKSRGEGKRRGRQQDRNRLGTPDPLLRDAALPAGEGPQHRHAEQRSAGGARR